MNEAAKGLASISVVIPCFNAERYIDAAIDSVSAQRWPNLEVIVVDDGSTDGSAQQVRERHPHVTLLQQPNRGAAAARNLGIEHARRDWISFLDADDVWMPGKLSAQWQALQADGTARLSYTAWDVWTSADPAPSRKYIDALNVAADDSARWQGPSGWIYPQLLLDSEVWTSTVLAHRSLFDEIGTFDTSLPIGEDYDLWLRASRVTRILRVARPLALYRKHGQSITNAAPDANYRSLVVERAIARWGYDSPDGGRALKADVALALARGWCDFGGVHLRAGDTTRARQGAQAAIRAAPGHVGGWKLLAKALARPVVGRMVSQAGKATS